VTGPAHIPWQDPRWQELLHGYNVWVHVEVRSGSTSCSTSNTHTAHSRPTADHANADTDTAANRPTRSIQNDGDVMAQACQSLLPNAARSSNLAALSMHVTRMLRELVPPDLVAQRSRTHTHHTGAAVDGVQAFSNRIAVVGKARATAGALNLLRILAHAVIVEASSSSCGGGGSAVHSNNNSGNNGTSSGSSYLQEVFLYKSRDTAQEQDTATDLLQALCAYIVSVHGLLPNSNHTLHAHGNTHNNINDQDSATGSTNASAGGGSSTHSIPELYDTTVLALQLLITLLSSQLYQPMISSFQRQEEEQQQQQQQQQQQSGNYFWEQLMTQAAIEQARKEKALRQLDYNNHDESSGSEWSPQSLLAACLDWQIRRPPAPERSIAFHNTELAESVCQVRGERRGADGMYESHLVVAACAPPKPGQTDVSSTSLSISSHNDYRSHLYRHSSKSNVFLDATKGVLVLSSTIILLPFRLMSLALGLIVGTPPGKGI
jgi:hypothetical protein